MQLKLFQNHKTRFPTGTVAAIGDFWSCRRTWWFHIIICKRCKNPVPTTQEIKNGKEAPRKRKSC